MPLARLYSNGSIVSARELATVFRKRSLLSEKAWLFTGATDNRVPYAPRPFNESATRATRRTTVPAVRRKEDCLLIERCRVFSRKTGRNPSTSFTDSSAAQHPEW